MSALDHHLVRRGHHVAHQIRSVIDSHAPINDGDGNGNGDAAKPALSASAVGLLIVSSVVLLGLAITVRTLP